MTTLRKSCLAAAVVALAAAMPATASARILPEPSNGSGESASVALSEVPPSTTSDSGFAWDDAGIGAGAALLVVGPGAGFAGTSARRRVRRLSTTSS
jgi:hypothetical protein